MERPMNEIALLNSQVNVPQVAYGIAGKYFKKCENFLLNLQ